MPPGCRGPRKAKVDLPLRHGFLTDRPERRRALCGGLYQASSAHHSAATRNRGDSTVNLLAMAATIYGRIQCSGTFYTDQSSADESANLRGGLVYKACMLCAICRTRPCTLEPQRLRRFVCSAAASPTSAAHHFPQALSSAIFHLPTSAGQKEETPAAPGPILDIAADGTSLVLWLAGGQVWQRDLQEELHELSGLSASGASE